MSIADRIYSAMATVPKQALTANQIVELLDNEFSVKQVQGAVTTISRSAKRFPSLHRTGRGVYLYDADRKTRTWVKFPNLSKAQTKAAKAAKAAVKQPVVEAKRPSERDVVAVDNLRPVHNASVMQDAEGNVYIVRATLVS
jgi:hypothetical protein